VTRLIGGSRICRRVGRWCRQRMRLTKSEAFRQEAVNVWAELAEVDDGDVVDELADRRWKCGERERVSATFPDAEVGPDRREALD
jgi:hypothetical protein